ncbi:MAG: CDP-diacylglycerol--serine O-phosphatidyltransferase [Halobacteriovoraceae bacterium]|nr:CDP-diacylglycerol--serine O-phosphatidyltransferase [Halobacteriovoraceae bacterium]
MSESNRRIVYFLPNVFTALNLACGFLSIIFSWKGLYYQASMILILGVIFDSVDGRIARLTGTQSNFGEQFDSLSDMVSFGVAPAILVYHRFLVEHGRLGMIFPFIFMLCGALRLARFNANIGKVHSNFFQGLPIPAAAYAMVGHTLLSIKIPVIAEWPQLAMAHIFFYSLLMISNMPFCSFKDSNWVKAHKRGALAIIFILLVLMFVYEEFSILSLISFYVFSCIRYYFVNRKNFYDMFSWISEKDHDI